MNIAVSNADSVEVKTLPEGDDAMVRERLRVLLELAVAIGRREGLLSNNQGNVSDAAICDDKSDKGG